MDNISFSAENFVDDYDISLPNYGLVEPQKIYRLQFAKYLSDMLKSRVDSIGRYIRIRLVISAYIKLN